jgi:hypothetical protein
LESMRRLMIAAGGVLAVASCGGTPTCPAVYANPQIQVPASTFALPDVNWFSPINAATTSAPDGVMVSIVASQGTVAYGGRGPFQSFLYERLGGYPTPDTNTYFGLGIEDGVWFPFWLQCTTDGRLTQIFAEETDRDVDFGYFVAGTCTDQGVGPMQTISVPAHTLSPIALTCGFTVSSSGPSGPNLMSSSVGSMHWLGGDLTAVYPFHTVDCRYGGCGSTGTWYEIHSVLWDPTMQVAGFGIIYLQNMTVSLGAAGVDLSDGMIPGDGTPIGGATYSITQ